MIRFHYLVNWGSTLMFFDFSLGKRRDRNHQQLLKSEQERITSTEKDEPNELQGPLKQ